MRQVALTAWLFLSHGFVFAIGGAALEARNYWLAAGFLVAVPTWRVYRRFREPRGYYLLGYGSAAGGDFHYSGGWISRKSSPARFALSLASEIFVIGFLGLSVLLNPRL